MDELNDSHQIAICVYNTIILSAFGLTVALILEDKVIIVYGVTSACIILGTSLTQAIVFFPKVYSVHEPRHEKINNVFEQVRHTSSCTSIEDG